MLKTIIHQVESNNDILLIEMLAKKIWSEYYPPIIGQEQVRYMLGKYQTSPAIKRQIEDGAHYYLMFNEHHPIGYFSYYFDNEVLLLSKIYVLNEVRGQGVGKKALNHMIDQARKQSAKVVRLTVNKFNLPTIVTYKQLGFETIDTIVKDIGGGFVMDDYIMEKRVMDNVMDRTPIIKSGNKEECKAV